MKRLRFGIPASRALIHTLLLSLLVTLVASARVTKPSKVPRNAVLLSEISTLTLRAGKLTSSRRVPPVPQLRCMGPSSVCALYEIEALRCRNDGSDYDDANVQWTCSASLPEEFKLGATDVSCEGYESSDDPYILKGSCAVEYRLVLTDTGEQKYGLTNEADSWGILRSKNRWEKLGTFVFWIFFVSVAGAMVLSAFGCLGRRTGPAGAGGGRPGWGGGGGGGGDPFNGDPPPPYSDTYSTPKSYMRPSSGYGYRASEEQWRPGFWTGAGAGAAASYLLSGRNRTTAAPARGNSGVPNGSGWFGGRRADAGEGPSRANASPSYSSGRYESTGFGSTSRR